MRRRKKIIYLLLFVGLLIGLTLVGVTWLTNIYEKKAVTYLRTEFSRQSDLILPPFETRVSVWKHFPRITFVFERISLVDKSGAAPLQVLAINRAEVTVPLGQFNPKRLKISHLAIDSLIFHERTDSAGNKFGLRFKQSLNPDTTAGKIPFVIPQLTIQHSRLVSENQYKKSNIAVYISQARLSANLLNRKLNLQGRLHGKIEQIKSKNLSLFRNQLFTINLRYQYFLNQKKGVFHNTSAIINKHKININGSHQKINKLPGSYLNLNIKGYQPLFYLINQLVPTQAQLFLKRIRTAGRMHFVYQITGNTGPRLYPHNKLTFSLNNGEIYLPASNRIIRNVQLQGSVDNGAQHLPQTSKLHITNLSARTDLGQVQVSLKVKNFILPVFAIQGQGRIDLVDLAGLMPLPFSTVTQGTVSGQFSLSGQVPDTLRNRTPDWRGKGFIQLKQATFRPVGLKLDCRAVNGSVQFKDNLVQLQNLGGTIGGQRFNVQATIKNYLPYLFGQPGSMAAKADIYAEKLATDWLEAPFEQAEPVTKTPVGNAHTPGLFKQANTARLEAPLQNKSNIKNKPRRFTGKYNSSVLNSVSRSRKNRWQTIEAQVNLKVATVALPAQKQIKNLSVQVNQQNQQVKLTWMRFTTEGGGKATANGGFNLTETGLSSPFLNVSLQYPYLNLQAFMQDLASFRAFTRPVPLPPTKYKRRNNYFKENDYKLNLQVKAKKLQYLYLKGSDLLLAANLNRHRVKVTNLRLRAFNGYINARGEMKIDAPGQHYPLKLRSQIEQINLQQLLTIADNMNLDVLSSRNIRGTVSCNLSVNTQLDQTFSPGFVGTIAYAKATFQKLELIEVAPIQAALRYLRNERTRHLYFEDATTYFLLKDYQFITPGLRLNSNLTAFEMSGTYTMQGPAQIDMALNLFNVLFGNNKRRIEKIKSDSVSLPHKAGKQHLLVVREPAQVKYKVKLSNRKEREIRNQNLLTQFHNFINQHQIDTIFTMRK